MLGGAPNTVTAKEQFSVLMKLPEASLTIEGHADLSQVEEASRPYMWEGGSTNIPCKQYHEIHMGSS